MKTATQPLVFRFAWRQYREGDPVPAHLDHGVVDALRTRGAVGPAPAAADPEDWRGEDKSIRGNDRRVKRK